MPHWRSLMDEKEYLSAFDLQGRDVTVTIESVAGAELTGEGGKKNKRPVATLKETKKKFILNPTNCKAMKALYGSNEVTDWSGKRVTLFAVETNTGEGIRIRPTIPPPPKVKKDESSAA